MYNGLANHESHYFRLLVYSNKLYDTIISSSKICANKQTLRRAPLELVNDYAIDIAAYAVMSNHCHMVSNADTVGVLAWSELEVAERWCRLFNSSQLSMGCGRVEGLTPAESKALVEMIATWRQCLMSIKMTAGIIWSSCFMNCFKLIYNGFIYKKYFVTCNNVAHPDRFVRLCLRLSQILCGHRCTGSGLLRGYYHLICHEKTTVSLLACGGKGVWPFNY